MSPGQRGDREKQGKQAQSWVLPGCSWTSISLPAATVPRLSLAKRFCCPLSKQGAEILGSLRVWGWRPEPCWLLLQPQQVLAAALPPVLFSCLDGVILPHGWLHGFLWQWEAIPPLSCPSRPVLMCHISREWPLSPAVSQRTCKSSQNVVLGQNSPSCPQPSSWGLKTD